MEVKQPAKSSLFHKILAGFLAITAAQNAHANDKTKPKTETSTTFEDTKIATQTPEKSEKCINDTLPRMIKGKVVDKKGEPIPGASIVMKGNQKIATVTDDNGNYSLEIPNNEGIILVFMASLWEDLEVIIGNKTILNIVLNEDADIYLAGGPMYCSKPKWWKFWKWRIWRKSYWRR